MIPADLRGDERGLALGVVVFIGMFVIAGVLYIGLNTAFTEVLGFTIAQDHSQGATDQITMAETIWNNIMFVPLFLMVIFLITRAVREGARP